MKDTIIIALLVIAIVLCVLYVRWIVNSDMPLWIKVLLLR